MLLRGLQNLGTFIKYQIREAVVWAAPAIWHLVNMVEKEVYFS